MTKMLDSPAFWYDDRRRHQAGAVGEAIEAPFLNDGDHRAHRPAPGVYTAGDVFDFDRLSKAMMRHDAHPQYTTRSASA